MFFWWLYRKLLRGEVTRKEVKNILEKENFVLTEKDIDSILSGNQKGVRFGAELLERQEGDKKIERYLKLVLSKRLRDWKSFRRQTRVAEALGLDKKHDIHTILPVTPFSYRPVPYVVMESRDLGDKTYGFMDDVPESYQGWKPDEVYKLSLSILNFHQAGLSVGKKVLQHTYTLPVGVEGYAKDIAVSLKKEVEHHTSSGEVINAKVEELITKYTGIQDVEQKALDAVKSSWRSVEESTTHKWYLVHADMQIDNVYKTKDGFFELFDFEWVGKTHSPLISNMYDYGNLRVRAWSSYEFRRLLDEQFLKAGKEILGNTKWVRDSMVLGRVRSLIHMSKSHLDYQNTVVKDGHDEERYHAMYKSVLESLKATLSKG